MSGFSSDEYSNSPASNLNKRLLMSAVALGGWRQHCSMSIRAPIWVST